MEELLMPFVIGAFIIVMGVMNMKGNISTLHRYHRKRVSEADRIPFGRLVGLGTIIIGIAVMAMGGFTWLAEYMQVEQYNTIGSAILVIGLVVGMGLNFYAMIKYNKGIF